MGFDNLVKLKAFLDSSTGGTVLQLRIRSNMENECTMWIACVSTSGAPRFSAIDWNECTQSDGTLLSRFARFELRSADTNDEFKAEIESFAARVQYLIDSYQSPLTLHQLARLAIREAVSVPQFKTRVRSLQLPKPLLDYLVFADEVFRLNSS